MNQLGVLDSDDSCKHLVQAFWDEHPCGVKFAPGEIGTQYFFEEIEKHRYLTEGHILKMLPLDQVQGKRVLEIGCGLGTDGGQLARHGANYIGMDLTPTAVQLTRRRLQLFKLPGMVLEADAENLPFKEGSFDIVYSHGVLHHTPDTQRAFDEVHRVLCVGGQAVIMLYHRDSWNYWGNIMFLRRLGTALLAFDWGPSVVHRLTGESIDRLRQHQEYFCKQGIGYLRRDVFLSHNTDGPGNPLSKVYTRSQVRQMFCRFSTVKTKITFMNRRWLPGIGKWMSKSTEEWLASHWGWHLWVFATK
jgi:SAM-dependent methyltransferase